MVYGEETAPRYEYDYNAKGQVARVRDNLLNRTTQSEYDLANRPVRVKTSEDAKHVYTGQVAYDNVYGNLSEFRRKWVKIDRNSGRNSAMMTKIVRRR